MLQSCRVAVFNPFNMLKLYQAMDTADAWHVCCYVNPSRIRMTSSAGPGVHPSSGMRFPFGRILRNGCLVRTGSDKDTPVDGGSVIRMISGKEDQKTCVDYLP
jgi:hypothetical protein